MPYEKTPMTNSLSIALAALSLAACIALPSYPAEAKTIYSFGDAPDGSLPLAPLVSDGHGQFFGTTFYGGPNEQGTIFRISSRGREKVVHALSGADGSGPAAGLLIDAAGNLYGTAEEGGKGAYGTVFKVSKRGSLTVLHPFASGSDGSMPRSGLIMDIKGNLYGTTEYGGAGCSGSGCGTVFMVAPDGQESVLYAFKGGDDGVEPIAGLVFDSAGNLYGTTRGGGSSCDCGTVFKLSPDGRETIIHAFSGAGDGIQPSGEVIFDGNGNLYGMTLGGGANNYGVVFKISPSGREKVIHSFDDNGHDGTSPVGALIRDEQGNFYGCTESGMFEYGVVFKLRPGGNDKVLYAFTGGNDGGTPQAGLVSDGAGHLFDTARDGGDYGEGVVFRLKQ
jgi:uncharacterized repeat protein (TIGR03803 family)